MGEPTPATLRLFPGITGATIRAFLMPPTRGVVLETFGAGNAPQRADLVEALKEACDNGVIIVAITQCSKGSVSDAYETGRSLLQAGVVPGGDMTPEVRPFAAYRCERPGPLAIDLCSSSDATVRADEAQLPSIQARALRCPGPLTDRDTSPRRADLA